jgi:hypothetical protein
MVKPSSLRVLLSITNHISGCVRLGDRVKNSGDVGSDAGDELGANLSHRLGEDTGAGMSNRLEGHDAGVNVEVVSSFSSHGACQAGGSSDGLGGALDDRGVNLGVVSDGLEAVVDVLATAEPLPRVTSDGSGVLAVVEGDVVADAESRSVVEVDNLGTISAAHLVAESQYRAWLRASDLAVFAGTLDGGLERGERLVERVAVTMNLGIGVAVLSAVTVEVIGRSNSDVVFVVFSIERSGGDGQVVLFVERWKGLPSGVDVGSTDKPE